MLYSAGCKLDGVGHIGYSVSRRNAVTSNVLGAAAYYNKLDMLEFIKDKLEGLGSQIGPKFTFVNAFMMKSVCLRCSGPFPT